MAGGGGNYTVQLEAFFGGTTRAISHTVAGPPVLNDYSILSGTVTVRDTGASGDVRISGHSDQGLALVTSPTSSINGLETTFDTTSNIDIRVTIFATAATGTGNTWRLQQLIVDVY